MIPMILGSLSSLWQLGQQSQVLCQTHPTCVAPAQVLGSQIRDQLDIVEAQADSALHSASGGGGG